MRRTGCVVAFVLVTTVLVAPTASAGTFGALPQQSVDPDVVVMTADVESDGDAQWSVAYRIRLDDDNDTQAFEDLRADIESNETAYTDRFGDRMRRTAATAENATGRQMAVENVSVTARQETFGQSYGVITYRFRWTGFAVTGDGSLEIGDALAGLFLDGETTLTVRWPAAYEAQSVSPQPDDRSNSSVTWRGQQQFASGEPRVVATQSAASTGGGLDPLLVGGTVLALVVLAAAAYVARRALADGDDEPATDEPTSEASDAASDDTAESDAGDQDTAAAPPDDLLSNEEQVLQLLDQHGGRIKQQAVASRLEWTDAKTSQVIGGLRDEDEVETFRIGRENVVTLPDVDVTDTDDETG
ncbi:helix-turn-helix transcriptional regulator [Halomicroarcula sp. GCM10025324]|uniref:helix-turn-helix transcriptional regulator n=1 Tax=Haloarcula TaxID=2237 RepID=UPI0023E88DF2|nr:hypothetical protein [Halomicroarcula sp. ZS-22-S1]